MHYIKKFSRYLLNTYKNSLLHFNISILLEKVKFEGFNISYSQYGEDLLINRIFKKKKKGVYVDVGCNRPIVGNNTIKLYLKGWSGINIDGNENLIKKFNIIRRRDINICSIVSNNKSRTIFYISDDDRISTISVQFKDLIKSNRKYDKEIEVIPKTLTEILDNNMIENKIDFLNIDVEGHDLEVLKSLDLKKYTPDLICIEDHQFDLNAKEKSEIYVYLEKNNYKIKAFVKPNLFVQLEQNN